MGNCQAAEAATVLIYHPREKIERLYWSVSAHEVMSSNPGHCVAVVVNSPTMKSVNGTPLKQLKLLQPDDTLLIGHVYRLVSFEDVLKELNSKNCAKLGKLLKERGGLGVQLRMKNLPSHDSKLTSNSPDDIHHLEGNDGRRIGGGQKSGRRVRHNDGGGGGGKGGHWRPALRSIDEVGG